MHRWVARLPLGESVAALAATVAGVYVGGGAGVASFPLDDAWIHLVYGLALRREGMLAYNEGVPATGCTSVLWALVAGLAHLFGPGAASTNSAVTLKGVTLLCFAVGAALAARLARVCSPRGRWAPAPGLVSLAAGLAVATCPVLAYAATSGMEVALTSALLTSTMLGIATRRTLLAAACAGLAATARPECVLVIPLVLLATELTGPRRITQRLGRAALALGPPALVLARTWRVSHRLLPATYYAKAHPSLERVWGTLRLAVGTMTPTSHAAFFLLVVVAAAIGLGQRGHRGLALAASALTGLGLFLASALLVQLKVPSFYFQRYFAPGLPLLLVAAVVTLAWLTSAALSRRRVARPWLARSSVVLTSVVLVAALLEQLTQLPGSRATFTDAAAAIDGAQVSAGRYLHDTLGPDEVVWSVDAGAIRYWGGRRTVDIMRLNTPDVFDGASILKRWRASAVIIVPAVFTLESAPGLLAQTQVFDRAGDPDPPERAFGRQLLLRCMPDVTPRRIIVRARDTVLATGNCADAAPTALP